jgi:hypothetical protein
VPAHAAETADEDAADGDPAEGDPADPPTTVIPPRQRGATAATARIVGRIGADRPARILAQPTPADPRPARASHRAETEQPRRYRHPALIDVAACLCLVAFAAFLTAGFWPDPHTRALALNAGDQTLAEWFLAYDARVYAGDFSLVTDRLNTPDGINLLANASVILLGVLLGPITLAYGAPVSFAVAVGLNLAATAIGWYLLFARSLGLHRFGAALGAVFAGFAPGLVAQSNGHLHITAQWLVPPIVWCVLRLTAAPDRRQLILTGALLGFLLTLQFHLGAEVLMLTAFGVGLFCAAYAVANWQDARRRLPDLGRGLGIAGGLAALLLAYPLWLMFAGPQHVSGGPFPSYHFSLDAAGLTSIAPLSLAGDRAAAAYATDPAEYNAFFGAPLLLVIAGVTLWLWRRPIAVAVAAAAAGAVVLALGPQIVVGGERTGLPGPYSLIDGLPGVSAALPGRFALVAVPLFAVLIALAVDAALAGGARTAGVRLVVPLAVVAAMAPIAPVPLPTVERRAVPRFFTDGYWRGCAAGGGVLVPVPPPEPRRPESMRWAAAAGVGFALPEGSFIGPYGEGGRASLGAFPRPTSQLLARVADTGVVPEVTDLERDAAAEDVRFWGARCFVLAAQPQEAALRETMVRLFGAPQQVADVSVWRVGT